MKKLIENIIVWYKSNHSIITTIYTAIVTIVTSVLLLLGIKI